MKRYFIAPLADVHGLAAGSPDPADIGEYHYIDLGTHGAAGAGFVALVMVNEKKAAMASWQELPHLLDAQATLGTLAAAAPAIAGQPAPATPLALLADVGAKPTHGGYTLAKQLATIHAAFAP